MAVAPRAHVSSRVHARRLRVLQAVFLFLATAYAGRLIQLQVLETEEWRTAAEGQNAAQVEIPAKRGGVYDRKGRPLALDGQRWRAYLAPREMTDPAREVRTVSRILGLSAAEEGRLARAEDGWVAVPRRISAAERERLMGAVRRGLHFEPVASRVYPEGRLGRPLLGAMGPEGRGASGLELHLDSLLRGTPGATLGRRDALGTTYWVPDAQLAAPRPGLDVQLTIDAELQGIAENALERALAETGASGGDILLLDPRTGELLAVASRRGEGLRSVPAFTDPFEPGSTIKPFLLAALLAEGAARLDDSVDTEGGEWREGRRLIRDVHPYDTLSVAEVVRFSSNVGAVKLARRLSPGLHYRYLRDFGFGVPSGIEYPTESGGRLRRPSEWSALSQASLAMGYEVSVTSLQLVAAYGALANGGVLMEPHLVKEVRDAEGRTVLRRSPRALRQVVEPGVARAVTEVLVSVVSEGTAFRAALTSLPVAGKTGTARLMADGRYEYGRYAASFVGFTPADDPNLVILTKLEDPQGAFYGGVAAAPISQATLQAALGTRGLLLDRRLAARQARPLGWGTPSAAPDAGPYIFAVGSVPESWPAAEADAAERSPVRLPDLRGLPVRSAVGRLHELGLRVELRASGVVKGQRPAPGSAAPPGATVVLE